MQATRERWGLDKPIFPDQFVAYLQSTISGDLGFSFIARGQTVSEVLAQRIWPTVILFGLGEVVAIILGLALGRVLGLETRRPGRLRRQRRVPHPLFDAVFPHSAWRCSSIFATTLHWFPTFGMLHGGRPVREPVGPVPRFRSLTSRCH